MKCRLVKLSKFSGTEASVYSVIQNEEQETLFDKFIVENKSSFLSEIKEIFVRLHTIGKKTGARISFFREWEGKSGDGVCALRYKENKRDEHLRFYCITYGTQIIVIGGGGPKNVRALQDDEKLKDENYFLRWLSEQISNRIKEKEIEYTDDFLEFIGDLKFQDDDEE